MSDANRTSGKVVLAFAAVMLGLIGGGIYYLVRTGGGQ